MVAKVCLALIGILYIGLAIFCTIAPQTASEKVGFKLDGGTGQSEFLVIYGGLELAMGLIFLLPLVKSDTLDFSLTACLLIHVCLVIFRSISFFAFSEISGTTVRLAIGEWVILIVTGLAIWWQKK